jgi:ATP-binding cassette subfamily B protein
MRFERTPTEDARIHEALAIAGLHKVVAGLPDGIDTLVGAGFGGRLDLSGGQWQRLALARLVYQDAPVMILDEPVASLDPEGERAVFELFAQLNQAKVILFTTHRYDSIPAGTKIIVLVDGQIAEVGTHDELLQRQRHYWSLYMACGPNVGNALGRGQGTPAPTAGVPERETSMSTPLSKLLPTAPAEPEFSVSRAQRSGPRLVYPGTPGGRHVR